MVTTISGYNENKKEIHKLIISKTNNNYFSKLIKYYKSKNEEVLKKGNIDMYSLFN